MVWFGLAALDVPIDSSHEFAKLGAAQRTAFWPVKGVGLDSMLI
jgi:hypothetical protein